MNNKKNKQKKSQNLIYTDKSMVVIIRNGCGVVVKGKLGQIYGD